MSPGDILNLMEKGPLAFAAIAVFAWFWERRENKMLTQELLKLSAAQVASQVENKAILQHMKELLKDKL
jgi:hypothetical protein